MRKLVVAFGALYLPLALCAQSQPASPQIVIRHLTLNGAPQLSQADRDSIENQLENLPFKITSVAEITERLRNALQERGFFKAETLASQVTVISSTPTQETIDVAYDIDEGQRYRLKEITFSNINPGKALVFPLGELRQTFPIEDGEIFGTEKIRIGLQKLRELYVSRGYVNFTPVPETGADDANGTVSLQVDLDEGLQFRVGALMLDGIEPVPGAGAKLLQAWKQYEGRVYDGGPLLEDFIRENLAYLPPHPREERIFEMRQDPQHRLLNFRLELDDPVATN